MLFLRPKFDIKIILSTNSLTKKPFNDVTGVLTMDTGGWEYAALSCGEPGGAVQGAAGGATMQKRCKDRFCFLPATKGC
jgi:hypothetical protein